MKRTKTNDEQSDSLSQLLKNNQKGWNESHRKKLKDWTTRWAGGGF